MAAITTEDYQDLLFGVADTLKTLIAAESSGSRIKTRYITSEGVDDEDWLANLRDEAQKTDIWLITFILLTGVDENGRKDQAVGTFSKPISVVLDYFADYQQGLDYTEDDDGDTLTTNTEREFLKKVFAVDLALEKKRGCLGPNVYINGWNFRLKIKRFQTASTHWANGVLNLQLQEIFL